MLNFLFIGIGQCGNKIANEFANCKHKAIAINTTQKDMNCLDYIDKNNRINIEATGTHGGAGKTPAIGQKGMMEHLDDVLNKINVVGADSDYFVICAGLGGGTGSGGTPILLRELIKAKKKIMLILTLPDNTEGVEVQVNAFNSCLSIMKLIEQFNIPYMLIENDKIKAKMESSPNFDWRSANSILAKQFTQFNRSANQDSQYSTFDETDYKKTLYVKGMMSVIKVKLNTNNIENENSLRDAIINRWKDNYFVDFDFTTARVLTTIVNAPSKYLENKSNYKLLESSLLKLRNACGTISPYVGIYAYNEQKEPNRKNEVVVYCMLTGLKAPMEKLLALQEKAKSEQEAMQLKQEQNDIDFNKFSMLDNSPKQTNKSVDDIDINLGGNNLMDFL